MPNTTINTTSINNNYHRHDGRNSLPNIGEQLSCLYSKHKLSAASKLGHLIPPFKHWSESQQSKYREQLQLVTGEYGAEVEHEVLSEFKKNVGKPLTQHKLKAISNRTASTFRRHSAGEVLQMAAKDHAESITGYILSRFNGKEGPKIIEAAKHGSKETLSLIKAVTESSIREQLVSENQEKGNVTAVSDAVLQHINNPNQWVSHQLERSNKILCDKQSLSSELLTALSDIAISFELRQFNQNGRIISEKDRANFISEQLIQELKDPTSKNSKHIDIESWQKNLKHRVDCSTEELAKSIFLVRDKILQENLREYNLI